jgi:hypothetical protein
MSLSAARILFYVAVHVSPPNMDGHLLSLHCSRTAKELRESISGAQLDAGDLEQQQQHLKRQLATLSDRIKRLESQVRDRARFTYSPV